MIDWKSRITNKYFWISLIPAIILLIEKVAIVFGISLDLSVLSDELVDIINTIFVILAILGIVVSHDTDGFGDGEHNE